MTRMRTKRWWGLKNSTAGSTHRVRSYTFPTSKYARARPSRARPRNCAASCAVSTSARAAMKSMDAMAPFCAKPGSAPSAPAGPPDVVSNRSNERPTTLSAKLNTSTLMAPFHQTVSRTHRTTLLLYTFKLSSSDAPHHARRKSALTRSGTWHTLMSTSRIGLHNFVSMSSWCQSGALKVVVSYFHNWSGTHNEKSSRSGLKASCIRCHNERGAKLILDGSGCHPSLSHTGRSVSALSIASAALGHSPITRGKSSGSIITASSAARKPPCTDIRSKKDGMHLGS
mmetsp:Transcript_90401/g.276858  ORF Transcript_90401/g.276858 Transcript_90401/m.276858 type:complete len:284 (-) Transcript_90401:1409-2260(-)